MNLEDVLRKNKTLRNIHAGKRCFIIGNGPSVNTQNITRLSSDVKITVSSFFNHPDVKIVNPDYWILADPNFWLKPEIFFSPLLKLTKDKAITSKLFVPTGGFPFFSSINFGSLIDLHFYHYDGTKDIQSRIDLSSGVPPFGQNVVIVALMLAYYLGCNPIYFIGCDHDFMNVTQEEYENLKVEHFHANPSQKKCSEILTWNQWQAAMARMNYEYVQLKQYAALWGFDVYNATRGGSLEHFPRVKYEDLFEHGIRKINVGDILSAIPDISSVLGSSAVKLINEGDLVSALVLLNGAISQNTGKASRVDGLDYLRAICLMGLGEQSEAIKSARQDYLCNPANREKSTALLTALGDDLAIGRSLFSINLNEDHHLISTPYRLLDEQSIRTADSLGVNYINDDLSSSSINQTNLHISTNLKNVSFYGRDDDGYFVVGGAEGGLEAIAGSGLQIGNRAVLASFNFMSTQSGVKNGAHGLFEIQLIHNEYWKQQGKQPLRCRIDNGKFYVLDLDSQIIAGSDKSYAFVQKRNAIYTLSLLLFQKGVCATLTGKDIPNGSIQISVEDCKRYIPGFPGFSLKANSGATSGKAIIKDWIVSPVGPYRPIIGAIGDSITAGLTDSPENESYVHIVTRSLGQRHTLNSGSGGAGTLLDVIRFPLEITPFQPRIVWIEGGTNDILSGASFESIFKNIIRQIKLITWGGTPLLSTIPPSMNFNSFREKQRNTVNQFIRTSGYAFVDRDAVLRSASNPYELKRDYDQGDGTHVNRVGHKMLSDEALRVIRPLLHRKQKP